MKNIYFIKITALLFSFILSAIFISCSNTVTPVPSGPPSDLTRSGKFISFTSNLSGNYDIYLAQVNGGGVLVTTNLVYPTNPYNLTASYSGNDKQSNWSPDGSVLVFSKEQLGGAQEIYAFFFRTDGSIDTTISPNPKKIVSSPNGDWDNNPSFSPDGKYLIWDRRYDNSNPPGVDSADARDLYIGTISGSGNSFSVSNIHAIITTPGIDECNPKWSPKISVRKIAYEYATSATATDHNIYIIDPFDTTNNVNYYNPGKSGYPAWEPACSRLIFESNQGSSGFYKIVTAPYPTSGTPSDLVANGTYSNRYPTWLPNGGLVAYISFQTGLGNIYTLSSSGGNSTKLLPASFDAANNLYPAW